MTTDNYRIKDTPLEGQLISYELCKELRESGFPPIEHDLDDDSGFWCVKCPYEETYYRDNNIKDEGFEDFCYPNLSELIAACGSNFDWLGKTLGGRWRADGEGDDVSCIADTPEEAAARLWLALNKKQ